MTHSLQAMTHGLQAMTHGLHAMTHGLHAMTHGLRAMTHGLHAMTHGLRAMTHGLHAVLHGSTAAAPSAKLSALIASPPVQFEDHDSGHADAYARHRPRRRPGVRTIRALAMTKILGSRTRS
jgi:hypothetical protein